MHPCVLIYKNFQSNQIKCHIIANLHIRYFVWKCSKVYTWILYMHFKQLVNKGLSFIAYNKSYIIPTYLITDDLLNIMFANDY